MPALLIDGGRYAAPPVRAPLFFSSVLASFIPNSSDKSLPGTRLVFEVRTVKPITQREDCGPLAQEGANSGLKESGEDTGQIYS